MTDGTVHRFPGSLGLAPAWRDRGLSVTEQRWVSACIAAHVNHFGVSVPISVRGNHPALHPLAPEEAERFTLYEGGFFGNVFAPAVGLFACASGEPLEEFPVGALRVCTRPDPAATAETSVCGFGRAGRCPEPGAPVATPAGTFDEVVAVFLDPAFTAAD